MGDNYQRYEDRLLRSTVPMKITPISSSSKFHEAILKASGRRDADRHEPSDILCCDTDLVTESAL